jgi:hypothetical protein
MKQKIFICLVAFVAFLSVSTVQAQGWIKTFNVASRQSPSQDVIETPDSGFVFSAINSRVVKIDKQGTIVWTYVPTNIGTSDTTRIFRTADNNFLLIVNSFSSTPSPSFWVIRLNSNGVELSRKNYLGLHIFRDADITPELDKIVIIADRFIYSIPRIADATVLLQLSINGDILNQQTLVSERYRNVIFGSDRQIYATNSASTAVIPDGYIDVVKLDSLGNIVWRKSRSNQLPAEPTRLKRLKNRRILVGNNWALRFGVTQRPIIQVIILQNTKMINELPHLNCTPIRQVRPQHGI